MADPPIKTCSINTCSTCDIRAKTNCNFNITQLFQFYLISLPSFIIGGVFIYSYHSTALYIWLLIIGFFFLIIEIRVLCSHCPHYEKSSIFLTCWANYGAPKLWKYRPGPMNKVEKFILILGFIIVWGYPLFFLFLLKNWPIFAVYLSLVALFFIVLRLKNCVQCINFSCPLNNTEINTRRIFFQNNPDILKHWENFLKWTSVGAQQFAGTDSVPSRHSLVVIQTFDSCY